MSINYNRALQELSEAGLVPNHIQALSNYLKSLAAITAVCDPARILPEYPRPEGMPQPALTVYQGGGFGRMTYLPFGQHFIDLFAFGVSGYHANKLLRVVHTALFPPDGPIGFLFQGCRYNNIFWGAERGPDSLPPELGGWINWHVTLQVNVTLVTVE